MSEEKEVRTEMPSYQNIETVRALKIDLIEFATDVVSKGALITPEGPFAPFEVDWEFIRKHNPQPGGYYVVSRGGDKSFSPAPAFEAGYVPFAKECDEEQEEQEELSGPDA